MKKEKKERKKLIRRRNRFIDLFPFDPIIYYTPGLISARGKRKQHARVLLEIRTRFFIHARSNVPRNFTE